MIVHYDGRTRCGSALDLRETDLDSHAVAGAVRGKDAPCSVHGPTPGPLFDRVGHVHPAMGVRIRPALATAARSLGLTAPQDPAIERARTERDAIAVEQAVEQQVGTPDTDLQALRERVAALRGQVQALEARGHDASEAQSALRAAAGRLSEAATARIAAEEYRQQTRAARDRRDRQLRLDDRIANLERRARAALVERVREPYERAVFALDPGADPFDAPPVVAALAVLRVASVRGPVVLATERFATPAAAAAWIEGAVLLCDPDV